MTRITQRVKKILAGYESDNAGSKGNLAKILMHGKLGGTGKLLILPVDQGFEHGPARSFASSRLCRILDSRRYRINHDGIQPSGRIKLNWSSARVSCTIKRHRNTA